MAEKNQFHQQAERINVLVKSINQLQDTTARATALELLQEIMSLHASVLDRMLDLASRAGDPGLALIDQYAQDPLISGLLVLYDLHPEDLEARIVRALDKVRPVVEGHGGDVQLIGLRDGVVSLRITSSGHGCASTVATLKTTVEQAVREAAPDIAILNIEGIEPEPAVGFVPLAKLQNAA